METNKQTTVNKMTTKKPDTVNQSVAEPVLLITKESDMDVVKTDLKPLSLGLNTVPLNRIIKGENIRTPKKALETADIFDSIAVDGLQVPLLVTREGILVDGNRRFNVLQQLQKDAGEELLVEVMVKDIPVKDIAFYQYLTMKRVNIGQSEIERAVLQYFDKNPFEKVSSISKKFGLPNTTVDRALKIYQVNKELNSLVLKNQVTQDAALQMIAAISERESGDAKGTTTTAAKKKKIAAEVSRVTEAIQAEIAERKPPTDSSEETEIVVQSKPLTLSSINKILVRKSQTPVNVDKKSTEPKSIPVKKQAIKLLDQLMSSLLLHPSNDGDPSTLNVTGVVSAQFINEISAFIRANDFTPVNLIREERCVEDEYGYYDANNSNGEVFIQESKDSYKAFNTSLVDDFPTLGLESVTENSIEFIRIPAESLLKVKKKLNESGIDTLQIDQLCYKSEDSSIPIEDQTPIKVDLLKDIDAIDAITEDTATTENAITEAQARADIFPPANAPVVTSVVPNSTKPNFDALKALKTETKALLDFNDADPEDFDSEDIDGIPY